MPIGFLFFRVMLAMWLSVLRLIGATGVGPGKREGDAGSIVNRGRAERETGIRDNNRPLALPTKQ